MEATKEPERKMDSAKPEVSETNKEKQIEKLVSMEKKVEVCRIIYIYVLASWPNEKAVSKIEHLTLCSHSSMEANFHTDFSFIKVDV